MQILKASCCKLKECCCKSRRQKCPRALKEAGVGIRIFIFLSGMLVNFFLGLCDYLDKFPKMFCSSCGMECLSTANFRHQCGQQLNLSQVSNKAARLVDKEKLLKEYFHRGYPYTALIMCTSDCGSGSFKVLRCILSLILEASDQMSNLVRFFCCSSSLQVTAEANVLRSCCVRFLW